MEKYFDICIEEARESLKTGDVPIGAIIVNNEGKIIAKAHNTRELDKNIMGHAEINVIKRASEELDRWNLSDCDLFVTLKPCSMCMEVIKQSRIRNVYYLLDKLDYKKEFFKTKFEKINTENEQMYLKILQDFFKQKR